MPVKARELRWIYRVGQTPVIDLLRGRVTGPVAATPKSPAVKIPLPPEARALVDRVVHRTGLWRSERLAVDQELSSHFADGLDAGQSCDRLIELFGDEVTVARLIRHAKRRNRPWPWLATYRLGQALAVAALVSLVLYAILSAVFFSGRPAPMVDYAAASNGLTAAAPEGDRAWPLYRQAILAMGDRSQGAQAKRWKLMHEYFEDGKRGPELSAWLRQNESALALVCEAASKPTLGIHYRADGWASDPTLWPESRGNAWVPPSLHSATFPYYAELQDLFQLLAADADRARHDGDGVRWLRDVTSLIEMSRQLRADPLTGGVLSIIPYARAIGAIETTLVERPGLVTDAAWAQLAHSLSAAQSAADVVSYDGMRLAVYDDLQRMYTDDGAGNGRITPDGVRYHHDLTKRWHATANSATPARPRWAQPASMLTTPSRQRVRAEYDRLMDAREAELHRPLREVDAEAVHLDDLRWKRFCSGAMNYIPPTATQVMSSEVGTNWLHIAAERQLGLRDGVVSGIALERYWARHARYPESLEALVPQFLPAVPIDRITGDALKYRLVDGRPLLYSVGADRDDDGGRPFVGRANGARYFEAARWDQPPSEAVDADWVLFPTPVAPPPPPPTR
jgi:hypothetical protein